MALDDFDPNNTKGPKAPVWATYAPKRRPQFKTHSARNHATNAVNMQADMTSEAIMYEFIGGEWVEVDRYIPPEQCAHCGGSFIYTYTYGTGANQWQRQYRSTHDLYKHPATPSYKKPQVCTPCWEKHFGHNAPEPIAPELCGLIDPADVIS